MLLSSWTTGSKLLKICMESLLKSKDKKAQKEIIIILEQTRAVELLFFRSICIPPPHVCGTNVEN